MMNASHHIDAAHQLIAALATAHGLSMVWEGKAPRVKSQTRKLVRLARPERL